MNVMITHYELFVNRIRSKYTEKLIKVNLSVYLFMRNEGIILKVRLNCGKGARAVILNVFLIHF